MTRTEAAHRYYEKNKAAIMAKDKARYAADSEYRKKVIARTTKYRRTHPEMVRASTLRQRHAMTPAEYAALLMQQGGVCAICGQSEKATQPKTGTLRNLAVDHDHETDQVRGLLCSLCNVALGLFDDDPERLEAATAYLRTSAQEAVAYL